MVGSAFIKRGRHRLTAEVGVDKGQIREGKKKKKIKERDKARGERRKDIPLSRKDQLGPFLKSSRTSWMVEERRVAQTKRRWNDRRIGDSKINKKTSKTPKAQGSQSELISEKGRGEEEFDRDYVAVEKGNKKGFLSERVFSF